MGVNSVAAGVLQIAGFFYLDLILWSLGSYLIKNRNQPVTWLASCPSAALMAGRALGVIAGSCASQVIASEQEPLFFGAVAFVAVLAALFLSSGENVRTGWGFVRPGNASESETCLMACQIVAEESGLTQREFEIMYDLVSGKTRKAIAEEMVVSSNAVKTHIHNLYRKVGVHSEEDLRTCVARRGRILSSEGVRDVAPMGDSDSASPLLGIGRIA